MLEENKTIEELKKLFYAQVDGYDIDTHTYFNLQQRDMFKSEGVWSLLEKEISELLQKEREGASSLT